MLEVFLGAPNETRRRPKRAAAERWSLLAICALPLAVLAPAAAAQERAPVARQAAVDLAYVLGESHALRQACAGPDDQYWRDRMQQLIDVEAPDAALNARLARSFNAGFAAGQASFPDCGPGARAQAARIAAQGRRLADALARP
jgi:uncharacterized protein (TIGR02301 family)